MKTINELHNVIHFLSTKTRILLHTIISINKVIKFYEQYDFVSFNAIIQCLVIIITMYLCMAGVECNNKKNGLKMIVHTSKGERMVMK
jgi:hypothetical protein